MARRLACASLAGVALLVAGCGGETVMRLDSERREAGLTWPAPQSQEVPRYRFIGELTGEANFRPADPNALRLRDVVNWIVGLAEGGNTPVVLQRPQSGAVDDRGRIFVTDMSRKAVFVFDEVGGDLAVWEYATETTRFSAPIGVAFAADGSVLVTDSELARVFRLDPASGKPRGEFGRGVLLRPTGIARDAATRRTFVADTYAHDVKVFDDDGRLIDTLGRRGDGRGEFNFPTHLAFGQRTLYVTDVLNARVQGLTGDGDTALTVGSPGLYVGNLVRPKGVATDDEGNVYVIESLYDHLLVFDRRGRLLLSIGGTGKDVGKFFLPAGVWTDHRNRVFVADMFNGRVVVFQFLGGT